jgi:hypothetical protein
MLKHSNRYSFSTSKSNWISVNELKTYFLYVCCGVFLFDDLLQVAPSLPWLFSFSMLFSCHKKLELRRSKAWNQSTYKSIGRFLMSNDWSYSQHLWSFLTHQTLISIQMNHLKIYRRPFFYRQKQSRTESREKL